MTPQTILISGGSRGLGATLVADYLAQGHQVATFSRHHNAFVNELQNHPHQVGARQSTRLIAVLSTAHTAGQAH